MSDQLVSIDEFLAKQQGAVKSGDIVIKLAKAPASWDPKKRSARFTMSAEVEDRDRDIVRQEGLNIDEFLKNPVAPLMHRSNGFPVGTWTDIVKNLTGRPKRTEGTLTLVPEETDEDADRLARHIAAGTIRACSIGFMPKMVTKRDVPDDKKDSAYYWPGYDIKESLLLECSPVTIPANPAALAKMASDGDVYARELLEEVLDNWAKHPETGLIVPRSEYEKAIKQATGDRTVVVAVSGPVDEATLRKAVSDALKGQGSDEQTPPATTTNPDTTAAQTTNTDDAGGETIKERSFLKTILDAIRGNSAALEEQIKQKERQDEIAEAERQEALAARRKELETRFATVEERARSQGIAV